MTDLELVLRAMVKDPRNLTLQAAAVSIVDLRPEPEPDSPEANQRYKNPKLSDQEYTLWQEWAHLLALHDQQRRLDHDGKEPGSFQGYLACQRCNNRLDMIQPPPGEDMKIICGQCGNEVTVPVLGGATIGEVVL